MLKGLGAPMYMEYTPRVILNKGAKNDQPSLYTNTSFAGYYLPHQPPSKILQIKLNIKLPK